MKLLQIQTERSDEANSARPAQSGTEIKIASAFFIRSSS